MMDTLLIANRGEIVARIARTARAMGIRTVGVFSDADRGSYAMRAVDLALRLPGVSAAETYLNQAAVLDAARRADVDAVHPGFGFLAEHAGFASATVAAGMTWVGPRPEHIAAMGDKINARKIAATVGVSVLPSAAVDEVEALGYPVMIKAAAGGGGKGIRVVASQGDLARAVAEAMGEAERSFGDGTVYVERLVSPARHIEVQVFGDRHGDVVHLFERECSIQRHHQKIIEEAPSPGIDDDVRGRLCAAAVALASHLGYEGAGTVEFVVGDDGFFFIEMNTRLQVEHPVTEELTGVDLVEWQLRVAAGEALPRTQEEIAVRGHAIEARLYAEDPAEEWAPGVGIVRRYVHGTGARFEDAIATGMEITVHYDPMIGKVVSHAPTRHEAARSLAIELAAVELHGPKTNRDFLVAALRSDAFLSGETFTSFIDDHPDLRTAGPGNEVNTAHLAAALWAQVEENRAADRQWGFAPAGWRNVPSQWSEVSFDGEEIAYAVARTDMGLGRLDFRRGDGTTVEATVTGTDPLAVDIEGITRHCAVHRVGDAFWVNSSEGQSSFFKTPRFVTPDVVLVGGGSTAPMPGTVISVFVAPGDRVDEHTDLLVMEAMKMEHRVRSPGPATVTDVLVVPGDQVEAGQLLVRLEEEAE